MTAAHDPAESAIPELLDRYGGRIFGLGLKICGSPQDAEDIVQETFLQAFRKWHQFDGRAAPSTWLFRIAARLCWRRRRRRSGEPKELDSLELLLPKSNEPILRAPDDTNPERLLERAESREALEQAIARMPEHFRMPLFLKELMELSVEEVAETLGLRPATVKTRIHRARLYLARELKRHLPTRQAPPPDHDRQICLDLLRVKQEALDRGVEFPVAQQELCQRCRSLFSTLDLAQDVCRRLTYGDELPAPLRKALLEQMRADG